jgi:hypothetical protein
MKCKTNCDRQGDDTKTNENEGNRGTRILMPLQQNPWLMYVDIAD